MIERKFVAERMKEFQIQEFVTKSLKNVGHSHTKVLRTPLGEKIIIFASRPGLVVGRKGENIKKLTTTLKKKFSLENPQIEISEVERMFLDAQIVAELIASTLERFGSQKFKGVGHKMMSDIMNSGALGVEIIISGKIPGARAKRWRFYQGYLKKCGDVVMGVSSAYTCAQLKSGSVGIQVRIMPPDLELPDKVIFKEEQAEEKKEEPKKEEKAEEKKEKKEKKPAKKKKKAKKASKKAEKEPKADEKKAEEKKEEPKKEEKAEEKEEEKAEK
jgi:small subunit ribosomal protein S3